MIAAVIQMNCEPGNIKKNVAAARDFIRKAADKGAEWAVLPELFQTGYLLGGRDREYAGPVPGGEAVCWMEETAREFGIMLTGGIIEEQGGKLYDTAVTVSQHGLLGAYRKIHLWGGEKDRFTPGDDTGTPMDCGDWKIGMQICYEAGFPEGARLQVLKGANALAYVAAFGAARAEVWDLATRARALESGCYVLASDRCGTEPCGTKFAGRSRIVAPDGIILAQVEEGEGIAVAKLELSNIQQQRAVLPYLKDLRTDLIAAAWQKWSNGSDRG